MRLLEHIVSRHSMQVRETVELRKADLERDKWIVERATAMADRSERQLAESHAQITALKEELAKANEHIRQMNIREM